MRTFQNLFAALLVCLCVALQGQPIRIITNHLGYEQFGPKRAIVEGKIGDQVSTYKLIDYNTNKQIQQGSVSKSGAVPKWKDWYFWTLTFDEVTTEGTYILECNTSNGVVRSFPFQIQKDILERNTLSNVVYYFKGQRSSGLLDKADHAVKLEDTNVSVDAHGGWFDATGDYGKHLSHLSFSTYFNPQQIPLTAWSLLKTYAVLDARNEVAFKQYKRKILDEAMYGVDYLVRVKNPKGSFYRSVSCPGPEKRPEDRLISKDNKGYAIKTVGTKDNFNPGDVQNVQSQATYEVSYRSGGGLAIAALAMASTYKVSGEYSNAEYLRVAEEAHAFLERNNIAYTNDGKENIIDDYCALMAATELYKATNKSQYKIVADVRAKKLMARLTHADGYQNFWRADENTRPFFHASDAGMPVVSLVNYFTIATTEDQKLVADAVKKSLLFELRVTGDVNNPFGYARQLVQNKAGVKRTNFFFPHDTEASPWWQGDNARIGSLATAARLAIPMFKDDGNFQKELQRYAWSQLNWILGLNPYDASMLHGTGRNNIAYMFFGTYQYTNAPGGICNGITGGYDDEDGIDWDLSYLKTGKDDDWRWAEQWLPHASWYLVAVALGTK